MPPGKVTAPLTGCSSRMTTPDRYTVNDALAVIKPEYCIELERAYAFPVGKVWDAITTAEGISAWMKYETTLERRVGGRILVDFKSEGSLEGIVCEWEPERVFAYTWGLSVVRWELEPRDDVTRLRFTNSHAKPDILLGFAAGWHAFIDHLGPYLAGTTVEDRYDDLMKAYAERFGHLAAGGDEKEGKEKP